ncbi:MAG: hypothetical protein HYX39_05205 [Bacteroidetes bacterium]|nr:hypothetical protein [Bacteroidota bacterium]
MAFLFFTGCKKPESKTDLFNIKEIFKYSWTLKSYCINDADSTHISIFDTKARAISFHNMQKSSDLILKNYPYNYIVARYDNKMAVKGGELACECNYKFCGPNIFMPENKQVDWLIEAKSKNTIILTCSLKKTYKVELILN